MLTIDAITASDFEQVLAIYNEIIRNSTAVYTDFEYDVASGRIWFDNKLSSGFPFLAARDASGVCGFAAFGTFRAWPCYRHSVEHSVHVRADRRNQGVGRSLLQALMAQAAAVGSHVMVAAIDTDNAASIGLHESLGFRRVGHFHEVGFKFGRWLDLDFLQYIVPPR